MKNILIICFILLSINSYCQIKHNFEELSKLVFDEINLERKKNGLLEFIWDDSLHVLAKKTNEILKKEKKLYHPNYDQNIIDNYEKILVNKYRTITNNERFKYESADAWGFIRDYNFLGEIICVIGDIDGENSLISKNVVKCWINSGTHLFWVLIHNTLVDNIEYAPFCSCDSEYITYQNKLQLIVTCNMYIINIHSDWKF